MRLLLLPPSSCQPSPECIYQRNGHHRPDNPFRIFQFHAFPPVQLPFHRHRNFHLPVSIHIEGVCHLLQNIHIPVLVQEHRIPLVLDVYRITNIHRIPHQLLRHDAVISHHLKWHILRPATAHQQEQQHYRYTHILLIKADSSLPQCLPSPEAHRFRNS